MPEFQVGDIVRVEMPRGYSMRGVLGISLMFSTNPEARFEGAIGTVTEIDPAGPYSVHQYLVDFRSHDNGRVGIPWQAQWFREEWLALKERPERVAAAASVQSTAESTWPERPPAESTPIGGIAHPEAKIYTEGRKDFAPPDLDPNAALGSVPESAYGISRQAQTQEDQSSGGGVTPTGSGLGAGTIIERGTGFVRVDGMRDCPPDYPIKGNAGSRIFHTPSQPSYAQTIPEICFESEAVASAQGFRPPRGSQPGTREPQSAPATDSAMSVETSQPFSGADRADDRSAAGVPTFEPTPETMSGPVEATTPSSAPGTMGITSEPTLNDLIVEQGEGFVRVQGMTVCPDGFPIKGNANSGIFHAPTDSSYERTVPEICFATEDMAIANGYRAPARRG